MKQVHITRTTRNRKIIGIHTNSRGIYHPAPTPHTAATARQHYDITFMQLIFDTSNGLFICILPNILSIAMRAHMTGATQI